jgi:hypothetical protein
MPTRERQKRWMKKKREEAKIMFGDKCVICKSAKNICFHRKDGKLHNHTLTAAKAINHPDEYVLLCYPCHKAIHWVMNNFNWGWNEIKTSLETDRL